MMIKKAFTLAEVLLTLAIIGVVAALTIPAVITKVTQDQYVVGLKKAYSTLKSVQREAEQEHGPMENWDWTGTTEETFTKYFKSHFDILKDCGYDTDNGCISDNLFFLNGSVYTAHDFNSPGYWRFITSDGISYVYLRYKVGDITASFVVDVNGFKGPNHYGRDIFGFYVFQNFGIKADGTLNIDGSARDSVTINQSCNEGGLGNSCAAKVLSEGAMNY